MPKLSNEDIAWAIYHDWIPHTRIQSRLDQERKGEEVEETIFVHMSEPVTDVDRLDAWVAVIPNPLAGFYRDGWTPWVGQLGALQTESPFGSVRAALRCAEGLRLARRLERDEMDASKEIPEMVALALIANAPGTVS